MRIHWRLWGGLYTLRMKRAHGNAFIPLAQAQKAAASGTSAAVGE